MTDFLKRTAQTALGLTPLVHPVVVSRYARDPHQPALENQSAAEFSPEIRSEIAPGSDEPTAQVADPIPRRTQALFRENASLQEGVTVWSRETGARDMARSLRSDLANPNDQDKSSFEAPALETIEPRSTENMVRPERNANARPPEEWEARGTSAGAESRREPSLIARMELLSSVHATNDASREKPIFPPSVHEDTDAQEDVQSTDVLPIVGQERRGSSSEDGFVEDDDISEKESFSERLILEHDPEPQRARASSITARGFRSASGPSIANDVSRLWPSPLEATPDSSSPPVVRVTIGRIEVRAVMPPSPPVDAAASPAPKLSLDEYLRQQNGRR